MIYIKKLYTLSAKEMSLKITVSFYIFFNPHVKMTKSISTTFLDIQRHLQQCVEENRKGISKKLSEICTQMVGKSFVLIT